MEREQALIGRGGFAKEIKAHIGSSSMKCFVEAEYYNKDDPYTYPISQFNPLLYEVIIAIANPKDRFNIAQRLPKETKYFTFIHKSAQLLGEDINIGKGSIICAGCILTTKVKIGDHAHLNLQTTIGHGCVIGNYFTTAPGVKVSGDCNIKDYVYLGTNSSVREKIEISNNITIGLNAGVVKSIYEPGVYVGVPAKKL